MDKLLEHVFPFEYEDLFAIFTKGKVNQTVKTSENYSVLIWEGKIDWKNFWQLRLSMLFAIKNGLNRLNKCLFMF
jgi:hypothetical protein